MEGRSGKALPCLVYNIMSSLHLSATQTGSMVNMSDIPKTNLDVRTFLVKT